MPGYIDKDIVKAEIERIKKEECPIDTYEGRIKLFYFERFLSFIDTLEVKEEVLDGNDKTKLMQKCVKIAYKRGYDMGVLQTTNKINSNTKEVDLELNSFDATVCKNGNTYLKEMDRNAIVKALEPYEDGDKVKVIIKAQK